MGRARTENFPVASVVLPRRVRRGLLAVYGFARLVDDLGDEAPGDRIGHLDWLESDVEAAFLGQASHPLLRRLTPVIRRHGISPEPFRRLVQANRQDQAVHEYDTFQDLLGYCALSANPVGHLVLSVLDAATPERLARSDLICTALQLLEHWQDVAEDHAAGRVYLPREDLDRFGVTRDDLSRRSTTPASVRRLIAFEVTRTRALLDDGAALIGMLAGRPALGVAAFVSGGRAGLRAIQDSGYDVLAGPPRATKSRRLAEFLRTVVAIPRLRSPSAEGT